jgi:hypothetical protein
MSSSYFETSFPEDEISNKDSCDCSPNSPIVLETVSPQTIRDMRHQCLCNNLKGVVANCMNCAKQYTTKTLLEKYLYVLDEKCSHQDRNWENIVFPIQQYKLELHAMCHPYVIQQYNLNSPQYLLLKALSNLHFNQHDYKHRTSCFKKGIECRFKLPTEPHLNELEIVWDEESCIKNHRLDGAAVLQKNFSIATYRNIMDMYMNTYSTSVSHVFGCNSNILGCYNHMFYTTLYSSKGNQEEEQQPFINVCNAVAKRIKRLSNEVKSSEPNDYSNGLGHVLSGIAAHINSFILSATMAWIISVV